MGLGNLAKKIVVCKRPKKSSSLSEKEARRTKVSIPANFIFHSEAHPFRHGNTEDRLSYGQHTIEVFSDEIALVLVDVLDHGLDAPTAIEKNIVSLLNKCRENGVTIIHAPNYPAVNRYPQYHRLKQETQRFLTSNNALFRYGRSICEKLYRLLNRKKVAVYNWPDTRLEGTRNDPRTERAKGYGKKTSIPDPDILRFAKPLPEEIVLNSSDELRYILWLRRIKLLLYCGYNSNECMLHRNAGINLLAGSDCNRTRFTIVVLSDCSGTSNGPWDKENISHRVIMDYYMFKIAFVAKSSEIKWGV